MSAFLKRYLVAGVYQSETPSSPRFLFGVVMQVCRLGIWSITQMYNSCVCSKYNHIPQPPLHIVQNVQNCTSSRREGGGV
jgi:hypothetical protein